MRRPIEAILAARRGPEAFVSGPTAPERFAIFSGHKIRRGTDPRPLNLRRILMFKKVICSLFLAGSCTSLLAAEAVDFPRRPLASESRSARTAEGRTPLAVGAVSHLLLPTSANVTGQFNAVFKTKVSIFNAVNASYSIRAGLSVGNGEISHTFISIGPGQTITYSNILNDLFGYTGGGAIDLDSGNSGYVFIVNSQVYVDTVAGRYTTAVQFADDLGDITPSRPGYVVGVSINSLFRVNVGCASNSAFPQTITFQAFDANNNAIGSPFSFVLAGYGWAQYSANFVLTNGGIYITASDNAVCYAVEVNNISNDGTFQLATPF
jgi:hypothetical protein